MAADITSSDVLREEWLPPRQTLPKKWPVLHVGSVPDVDLARWKFFVFGLVRERWECTLEEFKAMPTVTVLADMHCVTRWSTLDNVWEGVSTREVFRRVGPLPEAKAVLVHAEHGYTTNLLLDDFLDDDCLFAWKRNGEDISPDHGWPLRLVVPKLYAWKSAKWVRGIELIPEDKPGFWEAGGYHMRGDPWTEQRFR